jgi:glycosyltransferase involved in cell wall biosynthesis
MLHDESKLLLLTNRLETKPSGGREMLCKLNHEVLLKIFDNQLILFELTRLGPIKFYEIFDAIRGNIDGLNQEKFEQVCQLIQREHVRKVFVDGSNLGGFVAKLKSTLPEVEIITFFHNVEARFFWGALKVSKTLRSLAVLIVNYLAEKKATRLSDKRICLSERDSRLLKSIYGSGATHISPIALEDKFENCYLKTQNSEDEPYALFVGGNFYANREGISWFVKNVAVFVNIKVCVVGKGMEDMRADLEIIGRVEVIGPVDNLAEWYRRAHFVIAPIFDGSGMKTKVAEALMYGKKVVGTPEAFSGYESAIGAGWECRSADEFIAAMNAASMEINSSFDLHLREIYLQNYSFEAAKKRLKMIIL